jgi:flagellar protein FliO/FliZ
MLGPALRMVVSLAIVLALMYVAARLLSRSRGISPVRPTSGTRTRRPARRSFGAAVTTSIPKQSRGRRPARRRARLELVARQPLGKTTSVAVVRVGDRTLLLGVTDSSVQLLSELDAALFQDSDVPADLAALATALPVESGDVAPPVQQPRSAVSVLDLLRERTVRRA